MPTTSTVDFTGGVAAIGARTNAAAGAVTDLSAEESRIWASALSEGIIKPTNGFRPVAGAAATMNVIIGSGSAKADIACVAGNDAGQENYLVRLDDATVTVTLDAADPSNPRIDEIYLIVRDALYDAGSVSLPRFGVRKGDAAASPSAPGPDASWDSYILLASIAVPASAADILATTITDSRVNGGLDLMDLTRIRPGNTPSAESTLISAKVGGRIQMRIDGTERAHFDADGLDMTGLPIDNVGNVDGVDISAHAARHAPAGADPLNALDDYIVIDTVVSNFSNTTTTSFVDQVTKTFTRPAGWTTYKIMAWGSVYSVAGDTGARLEIATDNGPVANDTNALLQDTELVVAHDAAGLSAASVTLAVAARHVGTATVLTHGSLCYIAIRES